MGVQIGWPVSSGILNIEAIILLREMEDRMKDLGIEEKGRMEWFLHCNMEELLHKSIVEDWKQSVLDGWIRFKTAQFLEKIAYKKTS